jgi:alkylation response protein AidB-like acyl-CoA dehydrogenase
VDFELTPEQEALRERARALADTVFAERASRWDNAKDLVRAHLIADHLLPFRVDWRG